MPIPGGGDASYTQLNSSLEDTVTCRATLSLCLRRILAASVQPSCSACQEATERLLHEGPDSFAQMEELFNTVLDQEMRKVRKSSSAPFSGQHPYFPYQCCVLELLRLARLVRRLDWSDEGPC